jgi:hypothetical protein
MLSLLLRQGMQLFQHEDGDPCQLSSEFDECRFKRLHVDEEEEENDDEDEEEEYVQ